VFVTVLGYGMEVGSSMEDFATNRLATIIMALLLLPLALRSTRERMRDVRARNQEASAPREMRT
jgi:ABC-type phosphate transport system permease subunit